MAVLAQLIGEKGRRAPHTRSLANLTLNSDDVHALDGVQGAQAGVDRSVHNLAKLPVTQHDCAGATATLAAAKLGAGQADL